MLVKKNLTKIDVADIGPNISIITTHYFNLLSFRASSKVVLKNSLMGLYHYKYFQQFAENIVTLKPLSADCLSIFNEVTIYFRQILESKGGIHYNSS